MQRKPVHCIFVEESYLMQKIRSEINDIIRSQYIFISDDIIGIFI